MTPDDHTIDTPRARFAARTAGNRRHPLVLCLHAVRRRQHVRRPARLARRARVPGRRPVLPRVRPVTARLAGRRERPVRHPAPGTWPPSPMPSPRMTRCGWSGTACASLTVPCNCSRTGSPAPSPWPPATRRCRPGTPGGRPGGWWRSRHTLLFQVPQVSEWYVRRGSFAYIDELWRRWSPGRELPTKHLAAVKRTLAASWPEPLRARPGPADRHHRGRSRTPTLHLVGKRQPVPRPDRRGRPGAVLHRAVSVGGGPGAGHFLHLEQPKLVARHVVDWLVAPCGPTAAPVILPAPPPALPRPRLRVRKDRRTMNPENATIRRRSEAAKKHRSHKRVVPKPGASWLRDPCSL